MDYKNRATTQCRQRQGNVKIKSQLSSRLLWFKMWFSYDCFTNQIQKLDSFCHFQESFCLATSIWKFFSTWKICEFLNDLSNKSDKFVEFLGKYTFFYVPHNGPKALNLLNFFLIIVQKYWLMTHRVLLARVDAPLWYHYWRCCCDSAVKVMVKIEPGAVKNPPGQKSLSKLPFQLEILSAGSPLHQLATTFLQS